MLSLFKLNGVILILLFLLVFSLVFLMVALFKRNSRLNCYSLKQGGHEKSNMLWAYANKPYKKSALPVVDYDLPSLYEEMTIKDPWEVWPNVFRPF